MLLNSGISKQDMISCVLCADAPCNICPRMNPAEALFSIRFDNQDVAAGKLPVENPCVSCAAPCEKACVRPGKVPIKKLMSRLISEVRPEAEISAPSDEHRLKCDICGVQMDNPFMLSSSVVASTYDMCARAFEAGWAGVCFKTVCSFDIHEASPRYSAIKSESGSIIGFKNIERD